jgi:hypothetical protein
MIMKRHHAVDIDESEYNCGKIQISPTLPDIIEGQGRSCMDAGIINLL